MKIKDIRRFFSFFKNEKKLICISIFFSITNAVCLIFGAIILGKVIDTFFGHEEYGKNYIIDLSISCSILLGIYLIYFLSYFFEVKMIVKISHSYNSTIRLNIFNKLLNSTTSFIESNKVGEIIAKSTIDTDVLLVNMTRSFSSLFISPFILVSIIIGMFIISPYLALISIVFSPCIILGTWGLSRKANPLFMEQQNKIGLLNSIINEHITNKKAIDIFNKKEWSINQFDKINKELSSSLKQAEYRVSIIWPYVDAIENFITGILFSIGLIFSIFNLPTGSLFLKDERMTIGILMTFLLFFRQANGEIGTFSRMLSMIQKIKVSWNRIDSLLSADDDIDNNSKINNEIIDGDIEFKNVSFSYDGINNVLSNISFKVKKGEKIAFVGHTGSGKTTIINLLLRYYDISSGKILINSKSISEFNKKNLRKNISIVFQDSYIFNETILNNIRFGKHDATYEEIVMASKAVNANRFINLLPNKYKEIISNDNELSSGQKQLIALARAYISPAQILILDEATSSLDPKTEEIAQEGIMNLMKNKTCFIIAHRLSTIVNCDKIILLEKGKIMENGSHKELLNKKGLYYSLYHSNKNKHQI